ncbi:MAG: ATP-binding protein [Victivallaceae bacterium]
MRSEKQEALRELVLNAIVHRDYASPSDIQIKIFDNSINIFSPGKLFGNMTVEKLKTDNYHSITRNKLIAEAFYLTRDIEKYGSGYIRVREAIKGYPSMVFDYDEDGDGYSVTLSYTSQKTSQKTDLKTDLKTDMWRSIILVAFANNPTLPIHALAKKLGKGSTRTKQYINILKQEGALRHTGPSKGGRWEAIK